MRKLQPSLIFYIVFALLFVQWMGCHLHASADHKTSEVHLLISDQHDQHVHDHTLNGSIALSDIQKSWFKNFFPFLVSIAVVLPLIAFSAFIANPPTNLFFQSRSPYWRPILRAPPGL